MSPESNPKSMAASWEKALAAVGWVAAAFCAAVAVALAVTTLQARRYDPLSTTLLEEKILALNRDPKNEALRQEARRLDLQIRQTYFRRQAFAASGFYLLLAGAAAFLLANEARRAIRRRTPVPNPHAVELAERSGATARASSAVLAAVLGGGLAALAAVSRHDAAAEYAKQAVKPAKKLVVQAPQPGPAGGAPGGIALQPLPPPALSGPIGPAEPTGGGTLSPAPAGGTRLEPVSPATSEPAAAKNAPASAAPLEPCVPDALKDDWPGFRGPGGNGVALDAQPMTDWGPDRNVLWKAKVELPGWNSPVVVGDKVFVSGADKNKRAVYCFNAVNGDLVWQREAPSSTPEPPRVLDDTGYAPSTMASDGRRVFAIFPNGDVYAFDLEGKPLWRRPLGMPINAYGHASSLVVYGSGLIVQFDQGTAPEDGKSKLIALDAATGKTVWEVKRPVAGSWSTPLLVKVGGKDRLVTAANPFVIAYDPASGREIWRAECLSGDVAPSPAFGAGYVFVANVGSYLTAIRPDLEGDVTASGVGWSRQEDLPDIVSLLCHDGRLYVLTTGGTLSCLDAKTGKLLWKHEYNERYNASPIAAGGKIFLFEVSGKAHILEPGDAFKEIGSPSIGEEVRATPAFVSDRIYIRGKQHLFCIGGL